MADQPILTIENTQRTENAESFGTPLDFTVRLSEPAQSDVTVEFRTYGGTARQGFDFVGTASETLTIPAGETTATISREANGDEIDESDESFIVELSNPTNAAFPDNALVQRAIGTIIDDEGSDERPAVFVDGGRIAESNEGTRTAVFDVRLSEPQDGSVTFDYQTRDGSAEAGTDYAAQQGSLTFAAGEIQKTVSVPITGDTRVEPSENFSLVLGQSNAVSNDAAGLGAVMTILDDDAGGGSQPTISVGDIERVENAESFGTDFAFPVTLSEPASQDVTVSYRAVSGTGARGNDFEASSGTLTIPANATSGTIPVTAVNDDVVEPDESFGLRLFNPTNATFADDALRHTATGVIENDDGSDTRPSLLVGNPELLEGSDGTTTAVFDVRLTRPLAESLTLSYTTRDGTARAGSDYTAASGDLTFVPGQTRASVKVDVTADATAEDTETFALVFDGDSAVRNTAEGLAGTARILDDDSGFGAQPVLSVSDAAAVENAQSFGTDVTFEATLSEPASSDVSFDFRAIGATADRGFDFESNSGTVTIPAGQTHASISVTANGDDAAEPDETFLLALSNLTGAAFDGAGRTELARGIIRNDDGTDTRPALDVRDVELVEGNRGSQTAVFDVALTRPAEQDLTFAYATAEGSAEAGTDFVPTSGNLTFDAGQTRASVAVDVVQDALAEQTERFSLVLEGSDAVGNAARGLAGEAVILDDDSGAGTEPVLNVASAQRVENAGSFGTDLAFDLTLSAPAPQDVAFDYRAISGTADIGVDFNSTFQRATIPAGDTRTTVTVEARGEDTVEPDESLHLQLSNASGARLPGGTLTESARGTIRNDDGSDRRPALFVDGVTLNENDVGRRDAVFDVALSRPSDTAIDVTFTTTPGSASTGTDFAATSGRITFDPGQTHASVAVPVFADVAVEPRESFGLTVTGADIDKVGRGAAGVTAEAVIRDDDAGAAQNVPTINIAEARRIENTGDLLFQITLSRPSSGEVSFDVRTPNLVPSQGVAEAGQDFRAIDGSLTFEAGVTSRVVAVDLFNDDAVEPTEVLQLELSNAQGAAFAGGGNTLTARGVIEDDDTADPTGGLPALTASDVRVEEPASGSATATFTLSLPQPAGLRVTGDYAVVSGSARAGESASAGDFAQASGSFEILSGQLETTIDVGVNADDLAEDAESFVLRLGNLQNAQFPNNADTLSATGTIAANAGQSATLPLFDLAPAEQVATIYTAYFGRAPEPGGLDFWTREIQTDLTEGRGVGPTLRDVASAFGVSEEAKDLFPLLQNPDGASRSDVEGFVTSVFQNMFNRTPDEAGLDFWVNTTLDIIEGSGFVGDVLIQIADGAQNTDAGNDIGNLRNKIAVGLDYARKAQRFDAPFDPDTDAAALRGLLDDVTADDASVGGGRQAASDLVAQAIDLPALPGTASSPATTPDLG